jgi:hypothetical protein
MFIAQYELNLEVISRPTGDRGERKYMGHVLLRFSPVRVCQEMLYTDLHLKTPLTGNTNERSLVTFEKQRSLRNLGKLDRPVRQLRL